MTDYNITVGKELLPELLSSQDGLSKLVEGVLNQILEAQVSESLGADKHADILKMWLKRQSLFCKPQIWRKQDVDVMSLLKHLIKKHPKPLHALKKLLMMR